MNTEKLAILGGSKSVEKKEQHFVWPIITEETRRAVMEQMDRTISIYNRSDIFETFEDKFAAYHGKKFGLLHNSGTSALHGMYVGCNLQPGDEVICPTYTFYATVTPLLHTGAKPVFADCADDGNIEPIQIQKKITPQTKAIVVTHMWGIPCDMDAIVRIAKENNLLLLEDCSHAHGAEYKNQKVGSFGDAAAWSLQGQKTVTGGEGGILLTDNEDIHTRALLLGHYNKRCRQEIPTDHDLREYAVTGMGLKLRAHPFAIAMANQQFDHLDEWVAQRNEFAEYMIKELDDLECLSTPKKACRKPSWYAFVMQYNEAKADGVSIEKFFEAIQAEGLVEADRPGSTCPIHDLPLMRKTNMILPHLHEEPVSATDESYPMAENFYKNAIKIPIWAQESDWDIVRSYAAGIRKVALNTRELARKLQ